VGGLSACAVPAELGQGNPKEPLRSGVGSLGSKVKPENCWALTS